MKYMSRRRVIRASACLAATSALSRPYIANAQAKTASVLWVQGFVKEEDEAFKNLVAAYEKASGNKIEFSLIPFGPAMQKIVAALTSGDMPDIMFHDIADQAVVPQNTWNDKLIDVSRRRRDPEGSSSIPRRCWRPATTTTSPRSAASPTCRSRCGVLPFHVWNSMVEKAGFKLERRAEDLGRVLGLLQADAEEAARDRSATSTFTACSRPPTGRPTATTPSTTS